LRDIIHRIKRHVVIGPDEVLAIALWIITHSPILHVTSAEAQSGNGVLVFLTIGEELLGLLGCGTDAALASRALPMASPEIRSLGSMLALWHQLHCSIGPSRTQPPPYETFGAARASQPAETARCLAGAARAVPQRGGRIHHLNS
jgi:hypothetical protein